MRDLQIKRRKIVQRATFPPFPARLYRRCLYRRYPPPPPCAILPSTMQGSEGLAYPVEFLLCLAVTLGTMWLWKRFMGQ
jgi:hypothetical protein